LADPGAPLANGGAWLNSAHRLPPEVMPAARTFKEFGFPKGIRTDNGVPFALSPRGLSRKTTSASRGCDPFGVPAPINSLT
jgi:hypothetical protein